MRRSQINHAVAQARACFQTHGWALPPKPRWDVTDFGLGRFEESGLVLVNLAEHKEYCEKLMYARRRQVTPAHCHARKKEDIIARVGTLAIQIWDGKPAESKGRKAQVWICGESQLVESGSVLFLNSGERVTLIPQVYHEFWPVTEECIIGEVSTANDDVNDNFFINPDIGRFPQIDEDEPVLQRLISEGTRNNAY